ncbi:MAG TPA: hypothetical protein PLJ00_00600 [Chitinophagales bacterium]|nr:hypothetical protein [Chitinophagales bacterium]HRG85357.1 hypothetical protein [Chitinophagales bacterium]HRH52458.1 hypothetical protein [Chitinophagales bacterium]
MHLIEVNNKDTAKWFHELPFQLYGDNPNYIAPIRQEIDRIFDPEKNHLYKTGDAVRYIVNDKEGNTIGRIAAFYKKQPGSDMVKSAGCGFFECIDDQEIANTLFDAAKDWLQSKGFNAMDGPINFGERDKWWGLLVEGFDAPVYGMNYHHPYYKSLFEQYGFKTYFNQFTFVLNRSKNMPPIVYRIKQRLEARNKVKFRTADKRNLAKFAEDFRSIYNQAWANHEDFTPMTSAQSEALMREVKPIMDPELFIFAYVDDRPAGFFIGLPDANQILRYAGGNLNLRGMLNVLLHKPFVKLERIYGVIFGVVPEFQNKGVEAGMAAYMHEIVNNSDKYTHIELLWIGDFNKKMLNFVSHIQATQHRTLITYRKLFDDTIPFERCPIIL